MRSMSTVVGLGVVLLLGYVVYQRSMTRDAGTAASPQQQIDVVAVRQTLLALGEAERQYLASHSTYATLEELRTEYGAELGADTHGYTFLDSIDGATGFSITAVPVDAEKTGWPTLVVSQNMQVVERPASTPLR
jgi:hypothetical protein